MNKDYRSRICKKTMRCFLLFHLLMIGNLSAQVSIESNTTNSIYTSFLEYKYNMPSFTDFFYIDSVPRTQDGWEGTYSLTPIFKRSGTKLSDIWGFTVGTDAYIQLNGEFFKLQQQNGYLVTVGYGSVDNVGGTIAAAVITGISGYLVTGSIGTVDNGWTIATGVISGIIGGVIYSSHMHSKEKKQSIKYFIDTLTGDLYTHDLFVRNEYTFRPTKLILYREHKKQVQEPIQVIISDSIECTLNPNSYYEFDLAVDYKPIKIAYGLKENRKEMYTILYPGINKYIECNYSDKEADIELLDVGESTGEYASLGPKKEMKKRKKQE